LNQARTRCVPQGLGPNLRLGQARLGPPHAFMRRFLQFASSNLSDTERGRLNRPVWLRFCSFSVAQILGVDTALIIFHSHLFLVLYFCFVFVVKLASYVDCECPVGGVFVFGVGDLGSILRPFINRRVYNSFGVPKFSFYALSLCIH
jgi:hypothetical protein